MLVSFSTLRLDVATAQSPRRRTRGLRQTSALHFAPGAPRSPARPAAQAAPRRARRRHQLRALHPRDLRHFRMRITDSPNHHRSTRI